MVLYQLTSPADEVHQTIHTLANLGHAHFIDLNPSKLPHELRFAKQVRLIEDTERSLEYN